MSDHDKSLIKSFADQLAECRQRNDVVGYMAVAARIDEVCPHLKPHIKKIEFYAA